LKRARKPIATRQLTWHTDGGERAVLVRVWQPVKFKRDIYCDYAIDGLDKPVRGYSMGRDTLQALTLALRGVWNTLAPLRNEVYWGETQGWLGLSFGFDYPDDFSHQRRVEQLVEKEERRYYDRVLGPMRRRDARLRERYDPNGRPDYADASREVILEELRGAAANERRYRDENNEEGELYYLSKCWAIVADLGTRPDRQTILETMFDEESPRLRTLAAELLDSFAESQAMLLKMRDDKLEPGASEARRVLRVLKFRQRAASRPRPWDAEDDAP
jgi:hypothetical protein